MPRIFAEDMFDEATVKRLEAEDDDGDDDFDPYAVPPEAFVYLSAPDMGGPKGQVRVAVRADQVGGTGTKQQRRSLWGMLFPDRKNPDRDAVRADVDRYFAQLAEEMARMGAVRAYLRYDGGNDEGFAWFDHCVMGDGSTRSAEEVATTLKAAGITPPHAGWVAKPLGYMLELMASEWSCALLGRYGTGPYVMYGAFSVDLETGVVTDDPNPAPVVKSIEFGAG